MGDKNDRHYTMIELLKQMQHFDTNELVKIQELDNRLQFLESLLPKLPTVTNYDATLSSMIVKYMRDQLNDVLVSNKGYIQQKQHQTNSSSTMPLTHENIKKLEEEETSKSLNNNKTNGEREYATAVGSQISLTRKFTPAITESKAMPKVQSDTSGSTFKNRKIEISIIKYHRYNKELSTSARVHFTVNGKVLYRTKNPSVVDISMPTKAVRGENNVFYYYKWNYESFTISRKTLQVVIKNNAQAFITIMVLPTLRENDDDTMILGETKLYLENIIETINSPTATKIKLNVQSANNDDSNRGHHDILEIELRELLV
jgi:hypothetical protein